MLLFLHTRTLNPKSPPLHFLPLFHDSSNPFHLFHLYALYYWKSSIRITDSGCSRFKKRIGFRLGRQSSRLCFQSTAICGVRSRSHSADEEKVARLEWLESKMVSLTAILIYSKIYIRAIYIILEFWCKSNLNVIRFLIFTIYQSINNFVYGNCCEHWMVLWTEIRADIIRRSGGSCAWLESESAFEQMELYIAMISFVPKYHYSRIIEIIITNPSSCEN